jgi:hypothetical protein
MNETRRVIANQEIMIEFDDMYNNDYNGAAEWFNNDVNYRLIEDEMMDMHAGILAKDSILKYANWCLTGLQCMDAGDVQHLVDIQERDTLIASYTSSIVLPPPTATDYQVFMAIIKICKPLARVYYEMKRSCSSESFIHESTHIQYALLQAIAPLIIGDITKVSIIEWKRQIESESISKALNKVISEAEIRLKIYQTACIASLKIERKNKLTAIGNAIRKRELEAKNMICQKILDHISLLYNEMCSDMKQLIEEDSRIIKLLPPVTFGESTCPWTLPDVVTYPTGITWELTQLVNRELELFYQVVLETYPTNQANSEWRRRREISWVQNQLDTIMKDTRSWIKNNLSELSEIISFVSKCSNRGNLLPRLALLRSQEEENKKELLTPAELVCNHLQIQYSILLGSIHLQIGEVLVDIRKVFQRDRSRLYLELRYFLSHIITIASKTPGVCSDDDESSGSELDTSSLENVDEKGVCLPHADNQTGEPIACSISMVVDIMKARCVLNEADETTPIETYPSLPISSINYYDDISMCKKDILQVLGPMENALDEIITACRLQYPDFDRLMYSLQKFGKENHRSLKEKIRVYEHVLMILQDQTSNNYKIPPLDKLNDIISNISSRLGLYLELSYLNEISSIFDIYPSLNDAEEDSVVADDISQALNMLKFQIRWHRIVYQQVRDVDIYCTLRTLENRTRLFGHLPFHYQSY